MLSRAQQILLKQAQAQAHITDDEYRDTLALVAGAPDCRSSKDPRLTDGHLDKIMSFFETIYWRSVDANLLPAACKPNAPFRQRGYWAAKNQPGNTSRDRHTEAELNAQITVLEAGLAKFGCGFKYFQAIQNNIRPFSLIQYAAALRRTLASKQRKAATRGDDNRPF